MQTALAGNVASSRGGAISNYGVLQIQILNSLASGNRAGSAATAGEGGAIATESDLQNLLVQNSTLSGNTAVPNQFPSRGGAIWTEHDLQLNHVTIAGNTATEGGGLYEAGGQSDMFATLLAGNQGGACAGLSVDEEHHNLADDVTCSLDEVGDVQGVDPRIAPLANNGGPTNTHALYTGSPAIDGALCEPGPGTDQRLVFRPPGPCDIGAYEGSVDPTSNPPPPPPQGGGGPPVQQPPPPEDEELPPPESGKTVNALPASGTVKIRLPGTNTFVELEEGQQIPVGTVIDVTKGRVTLVAAGGQQATFSDGIFKIGQGKGAKPLTTLTLVEALSCPKSGKANIAAKKKKKRRLWGDGSGNFQTKGKHSAATVVGTKWLVEDRCDSTLTRVVSGRVSVRDFAKKKTVIVRAGKKYVAEPKK